MVRGLRKSVNLITCALMLVCGSLLLILMFELANLKSPHAEAMRLSSKSASKRQMYEEMKVAEYSPPSASDFSVISKRPLFWPSRAPFIASLVHEAPAPNEPFSLALVGVIITSERRWALLRRVPTEDTDEELQAANSAMSAHEGQELDGWLIQVIEKDAVILRHADVVQVLKLNDGLPGQVQIVPCPANDFYDIDMFLPGLFNEHLPPGKARPKQRRKQKIS